MSLYTGDTLAAVSEHTHMEKKHSEQEGRKKHEPLLLFLSLWHCLAGRIYQDFSLGRAMTEAHKGNMGWERRKHMAGLKRKNKHIVKSHAYKTQKHTQPDTQIMKHRQDCCYYDYFFTG